MKKIALSQGQFALVDDSDFDRLNQHKWYANKCGNTFYAFRKIRDKSKKSGRRTLLMHRAVLKAKAGQIVDHIDRNGLNCQQGNLRFASHSLNMLNQRLSKNNTSGYKGVFWYKRIKKWRAMLYINNKPKFLGYYDTAKQASVAYQTAFKARMKELTS